MRVPSEMKNLIPKQDPLVRILAEMLDSSLRSEAEHPGEVDIRDSGLTEAASVIHLILTDILLFDPNPNSPPEGDTNVSA